MEEAREVLAQLGFDAERANERSALVLLSLAHMTEETPWTEATNPMLGTRAIMDWIRDEFDLHYKPNSRETIRRFSLHQFIEGAMVEENADKPDRPTNSPKWNYRIAGAALAAIQTYGTEGWEFARDAYLETQPGLVEANALRRYMQRIPITLPGGDEVRLSPGGQNVLLRDMVHEFCPRFTPGGEVLYLGDADAKWAYFHAAVFEQIGVTVGEHGKMPDLVVYQRDKNWLFLMEACSSHGPVDSTRHRELRQLFGGSTAGLIHVSCFPNRAVMRQYLADIAWESEAWCADNPDHMMHFNGCRFLGPYEGAE